MKELHDAIPNATANWKSAGDLSDASSAEQPNPYLKVICSNMTNLVGTVRDHSNKSLLLPARLADLEKLVAELGKARLTVRQEKPLPRKLKRRLNEATWHQIAEEYRSGATTPALCVEYGLSKGGLLKLLRDQGVELRCQPLTPEQVEEATLLYGNGSSIQAIADHFDVSYNGVRQALVRAGIERRPRGGSRPRG